MGGEGKSLFVMKIMSYNVRGLGGRVKKRVIRELVQKEDVGVLCIQESKVVKVELRLCGELWGDQEVEWR